MKFFLLFFLITWSFCNWAQDPKGIPTDYMNDPAVDLMRNGKILWPQQVHTLRESSKKRFDISKLDPDDSTDLWKNTFVKDIPADLNPIMDLDEVQYHSPVLSVSGIFRFNIENKLGDKKLYTMMLSRTVHSVLLAKSLLRKLGYQLPDIKYIPRVVVKFKDKVEKLGFISYLENVAMAGSAKSWVVEHLDDNRLLLQDLIVFDSNNIIYNLAVGVTDDMIQGRRLLSSLVVPLTIVNLTESINLLKWDIGYVNNKEIFLYNDQMLDFQCSWDDARWTTRRIEKLTREDWKDIVASTYLPKPIQTILLEKLISRRNSAMKLFKIDAEMMPFDPEVSDGVDLVRGKITKKSWDGYSAKFAYGDPESPLTRPDIISFIKSRAISAAIDLALSEINKFSIFGTNIQEKNAEKFQAELQKAIQKSVETKTPFVMPSKVWAFPTIRGELLSSRNIVTGTYLGTDNLVQLADTIGVTVSGGYFVGSMGLPTPLSATGSAQAQYLRTYTHLRPIKSISIALNYPARNIIVPLVKKEYGKKIHDALLFNLNPNASEAEKIVKIKEAVRPIKESMLVGESLIVTESIAANAVAQLGGGYKQLLKISLGLIGGYSIVSRFHVHRRSENEFQIYSDSGNVGSLGAALSIDSIIPIVDAKIKGSKGGAKVKFYSLNLDPKNPKIFDNLRDLRAAIIHSSTSEIQSNKENGPLTISHSFREYTPSLGLLYWQNQKISSATSMELTNPQGIKKYYRRAYYGKSKGKNYQSYVTAAISRFVNILFNIKTNLSDGTGNNPGYSVNGSAETKFLTYDQEVNSEGEVLEPFIRINRIYNGWSIDQAKAYQILDRLKTKYRHEFFQSPILNETRRIFMYNISLNVLLYQRGIENLLSLSDDEIKRIFRENKSQEDLTINPLKIKDEDTKVGRFLRLMKRYRRKMEKKNFYRANKVLLKALYLADDNLTLAGISQLAGGEDNMYVNTKIDGYREGDEAGDKPIESSSVGEFGSEKKFGPISDMADKTRMLDGEFFIYWLMTRLI